MNQHAEARRPARAPDRPEQPFDRPRRPHEACALGRELFMLRIRQGAAAAGIPAFIHTLANGTAPGRQATQRFLVIDGGAGRAECALTAQMLEEYADGSAAVDAEIERITQRLVLQLKAPYRPGQWPTGATRGPHAPERRAKPRTTRADAP